MTRQPGAFVPILKTTSGTSELQAAPALTDLGYGNHPVADPPARFSFVRGGDTGLRRRLKFR